jgi:hypothetical protein
MRWYERREKKGRLEGEKVVMVSEMGRTSWISQAFPRTVTSLCGKEEEKQEERGGNGGGRVSHGYYQYAPHHDTSHQLRIFGEDPRRAGFEGFGLVCIWYFTEVIIYSVYSSFVLVRSWDLRG